jgi:hypothetical protein
MSLLFQQDEEKERKCHKRQKVSLPRYYLRPATVPLASWAFDVSRGSQNHAEHEDEYFVVCTVTAHLMIGV